MSSSRWSFVLEAGFGGCLALLVMLVAAGVKRLLVALEAENIDAFKGSEHGAASPCAGLESWLHKGEDWRPQGFHVVCRISNGSNSNRRSFWAFKSASRSMGQVEHLVGSNETALRESLETALGMPRVPRWRKYPWKIFNVTGHKIKLKRLKVGDIGLVFEGGEFQWPATCKGCQRQVDIKEQTYTLRTVSLDPVIFVIDGFLSDAETRALRDVANAEMGPAYVSPKGRGEMQGRASNERTGTQTFLFKKTCGIICNNVFERARALTRQLGSDELQVIRYQPGEQYEEHWDYFVPHALPQLARNRTGRSNPLSYRRNRVSTLFLYLTDVDSGGETAFFRAHGANNHGCDEKDVLKVNARRGRAVLFYSLRADGTRNPSSLHAGCPVGTGAEKWCGTVWFWNTPGLPGPDWEDDEELEAELAAHNSRYR